MISRVIDLDILTYDSLTIKTEKLIIPHLRMHERLFVIAPLCDIAGDFKHPVFGITVSELFRELSGTERVMLLDFKI